MTVHLSPEYLESLIHAMAGQQMSEIRHCLLELKHAMKVLGITRMSVNEGDWLNKIKQELEHRGVKLPKEFWEEEIKLVQELKP